MDNMKVNNKRLQKLILDTQKSVGQLSKLAYETGVQDGLIKANALNALKPLDNTSMRWIPCSERLPEPRIDVWCNSDMGQMVGYYEENVETWYGRDYLELMVTAWMPLPEPYLEVGE